jgi:hypothetical protein
MQTSLGRIACVLGCAALAFVALVGAVSAQALNQQRDCMTILKCNYVQGGSFRGCISSYSCKTCRMVPAKCTVRGERTCQKVTCGWGA